MKSRTLLAPALLGFGFILGVPALGDDGADSSATTAATVDVVGVDVTSNEMTLCVASPEIYEPQPFLITAGDAVLADVTLKPGDNFILVPVVDPDVVGVSSTMPDNPGSN